MSISFLVWNDFRLNKKNKIGSHPSNLTVCHLLNLHKHKIKLKDTSEWGKSIHMCSNCGSFWCPGSVMLIKQEVYEECETLGTLQTKQHVAVQ